MNTLRQLQGVVLKAILFIVWFDLACFVLILVGAVFNWSFVNEVVSSVFLITFVISAFVLGALAILHVVLTLNIVSESMVYIAKEKGLVDPEPSPLARRRFRNALVVSVLGIFILVLFQGIVEYRVGKYKVHRIQEGLKDVANSRLVMRLVDLIEQDGPINQLYLVRDELLLSLDEDVRGITLLIPKKGEEGLVFYEITPWDYDYKDKTPISQVDMRLFIPHYKERKKFDEMIKTKTPFTVVGRYSIHSFYPVVRDGDIKLVLFLDTSRQVSNDYLISRGKAGL